MIYGRLKNRLFKYEEAKHCDNPGDKNENDDRAC